MSNKPQFVLKATCAAVLAVLANAHLANAEEQVIETKKIEVISTSPFKVRVLANR